MKNRELRNLHYNRANEINFTTFDEIIKTSNAWKNKKTACRRPRLRNFCVKTR